VVLVLKAVETTTSTVVEDALTEVTNVVMVAVGRRHATVPDCCVVRLSESAQPPSIESLEQLWVLSPEHALNVRVSKNCRWYTIRAHIIPNDTSNSIWSFHWDGNFRLLKSQAGHWPKYEVHG